MTVMNPVGKLVESQFSRPNLGVAVLFFALPFLLQVFFWFVFGVQANFGAFILRTIIPAVMTWVVSAALLYVLLIGFKGKSAIGSFMPVLSALPVFNLVYFLGLLFMSAVFFFAAPQFFQARGISQYEVTSISYSIASNPQPVHWLLLIAGILMGLMVMASYFYIVAKIGRVVKDTGAFSDTMLAVVFAAMSFTVFTLLTIGFSGL